MYLKKSLASDTVLTPNKKRALDSYAECPPLFPPLLPCRLFFRFYPVNRRMKYPTKLRSRLVGYLADKSTRNI
jgi:hypothetical protein